MEGNFQSEIPPLAVDIGCADDLSDRSSSESVESCGDVLHCEEKVDNKIWTDEMHNLYLEHLEDSFVKHLHQSMGLLAQCSDKNKRGKYASQLWPVNPYNTAKQVGCWEMINHGRCNIRSLNPAKGLRMDSPRMSAGVPHPIFHTENHGKEGTGQNFVDDDSRSNSNINARVKRLKTASVDS